MRLFRPALSTRDVLLVLLGALAMYGFEALSWTSSDNERSIFLSHQLLSKDPPQMLTRPPPASNVSNAVPVELAPNLPETTIISHAPGWTVFQNLYMSEGTLLIVSSHPRRYFPNMRMMTSTGLEAENTPENIRMREPTREDMDVISPEEAKRRWGGDISTGEPHRVREIEGTTFLINDPPQFLRHYYHFVAELLLGAWAFWTGTFSRTPFPNPSLPQKYTAPDVNSPPPFQRFIFIHSDADGWRDDPGFNSYFLRAAFPSLTVEHIDDWTDRVLATSQPQDNHNFLQPDPDPQKTLLEAKLSDRAWVLPIALFTDRSAAFRGKSCGSKTQRTASEAVEAMQEAARLQLGWWEPVRQAVAKFAGVYQPVSAPKAESTSDGLQMPTKIVITYISRQGSRRRRLISADHDRLVLSLRDLVKRKNRHGGQKWELNIVQAEQLTKDTQVRIAATTTILLGVHGNGLTHLVLMAPTRVSTVIEMFYPGGFAHDYEWTTRALGMKHFAFWNDTYRTHPNEPSVNYPEGFQGSSIPIHGPAVAKLIEDRVVGRL